MSRHANLVKELAGRLRGMDVARLVYFHTDHFEPWRPVGVSAAVGPEIVDTIGDFCHVTERMDFARRLTLFYKPHLNYALQAGAGLIRADPRDLVGFLPRGEHEERFGCEAMGQVANSAHDVQIHIHHEYYTATTAHNDLAAIAWFAGPFGRAFDGQRLELAIRLNREIVARETGRSAGRWFFIHGHWALNGSDDSSCTITNEIDILLRNGCFGAFTFPAGRQHVNPRIRAPYLCRPFDAPKGYDRPEAQPEIALGNASKAARKFFIWASPATYRQCSLDYLSPSIRKHLENTDEAARQLIDTAYVADRTLFIKTHAHSMHPYYFEHARAAVIPHQYPPTQTMLSVVFEAAAQAELDIQFLTVPEVYDRLVTAEKEPEIDLVATYLETEKRGMKALPETHEPEFPPIVPARAVEVVRETVAAVLQQRIDTLGIRGSGAYEHYGAMLRRGFPIPLHDLEALEVVRQQVPRLRAYHEIGSGIGTLPFLLALNGFPSVGIECDRRRHETSLAIWQELSAKAEVGKSRCRLVFGRFPAAVPKGDTLDALAILTDFVTTQTVEQARQILAGLCRYPYVLVDLQRFCVMRRSPSARLELLNELCALGFDALDAPSGVDCAFVLLRNRAAAMSRPRTGLWSRLIFPRRRKDALRPVTH